MSDSVELVEVGPRDGLQNESVLLSAETKIRFVNALSLAGHTRIEATAFVSPARVPQMADAFEVMTGIERQEGVRYSALVPNEKGLERALDAGTEEIAVFTATSDTFNRKNTGVGLEDSFKRLAPVVKEALARKLLVRGYLSTILHCPYEGRIDPALTVRLTERLLDLGCYEVSLGETLGRAVPGQIRSLCADLTSAGILDRCAGHFHDTYGLGIANILEALSAGIRTFDASAGGLGGCPYAPGAAGNVATEDLLYMFQEEGMAVAPDLQRQVSATALIESALARPLPGKTYRALRCESD